MTAAAYRTKADPYAVLVADDQSAITHALQFLLKSNGMDATVADSPEDVLREMNARRYDLLLMDMNYARDTTSGKEGLDLLEQVRQLDPALRVVVMTAWSTIELAVAALQRGAADFIQKPWDNNIALDIIYKQAALTREHRREQAITRHSEEDALQVHRSLLGAALRKVGPLTMAASTRAAKGVGGDYYDSFETMERKFAFCIADCMGKGTAAALVMANLQAHLRFASAKSASPAAVCSSLNDRASSEEHGRLTTMFYGVVDTQSRMLHFTNAGHFPGILVRADGSFTRLTTEDALLGAIPSWTYREESIQLLPGDRLLLITDGLVEATGATGEELGEEILVQWAVDARDATPPEFLDKIFKAALEFCSHRLNDDATAVVVGLD